MNQAHIYTKVMAESIRNSGMWLKEAKILTEKGSKEHARALLIFSGEELGKAAYCWFVRIRLIPMNHPDVDYIKKNRDGIFKSHSLKNVTALGLILSIEYPDAVPDDELNPDMTDPYTNTPSTMREVLAKMGAHATWARMRWMYVDIVEEQGEYVVITPLKEDTKDIVDGIEGMERTLNAFKKIVRVNPLPDDMLEWIESTREFLKNNDERFPDEPAWA